MDTPKVRDFLKEFYEIWITERPTQLAAALAYYGMFSFAPIIYIAIIVAGFFLDELALAERLFSRIESALGPETAAFVQDSVLSLADTTSGGSILISLISFVALLVAASGLFFQLQFALNSIWKVPPSERGGTRQFLRQRGFSFLMVMAVGLFLIASAVLSLITTWLNTLTPRMDLSKGFTLLGFIGLVYISIVLIYKILPDTKIAWRDVWVGAALATLLTVVGGWLVFTFVGAGIGSALEAAGAVAVILIGIYYIAQIFLFGAVFSRVYAGKYGSRRGAEPLDSD